MACAVLGALMISCGDDDGGVDLRDDASRLVRDGRADQHSDNGAGPRILSGCELECAVG